MENDAKNFSISGISNAPLPFVAVLIFSKQVFALAIN